MSLDPEQFRPRIAEAKRLLKAQISDLPERFAAMTARIQQQVEEIQACVANGESPIPEVDFADLQDDGMEELKARIRRRGCVVVRNVFPREQVDEWNRQLMEYVNENDYFSKEVEKRGLDNYFSALASGRPQIFGLYWSKPQVMARQSEQLALTRRWLNRLWTFEYDGQQVFNPDQECSYADRVRQREPGDKTLGLSPHVDGGTIERWIEPSYRQVYRHVFGGDLAAYQPFDSLYRTEAVEIPSPAVCRMFRTYQGWTAMSQQGPGDGTLNLVPIADAMAWMLLRALQDDVPDDELCGAKAGRALSVTEKYHQLLLQAFVPIPTVYPGDTVWWHPDVIHGVEDHNKGQGYSNVIYIGAAPDCQKNRDFLALQRPAFEAGESSPDFAPENYEVAFTGRALPDDLTELGRRQMGY
ncbi:hypothetical protein WH50_11065 [Pokkaliibacter plantistimulans]|uniref:DUF1479 domain-containing protein n=1 Tax=Pokkaliibacter plantistimulans TaxID=1635171 RepID=A0ABX5LWY5_9GAMM|nr:YbiU family protein [Pokkaliibacter plantistimulans]PXF31174.1 hypothetical protein WH50_11065 [Pokkaliibacter plantistimulans]